MAVYTEVSNGDLETFVALYDIGQAVSCKGIAEGVENSNFLLSTDRGRYILTLYEKRVARADLPFFLGLMDHLAGKGIVCPTPIHQRGGPALGALLMGAASEPLGLQAPVAAGTIIGLIASILIWRQRDAIAENLGERPLSSPA